MIYFKIDTTISMCKVSVFLNDMIINIIIVKKFCGSLREHAMNVIIFEKKKMKILTKEQLKS